MTAGLKRVLAIVLAIIASGILAERLKTSYSSPPGPVTARFGERLALAGEFTGPLPLNLDDTLSTLALRWESAPDRQAVIHGEIPPETDSLSDSYRLWLQHLTKPQEHLKNELLEQGYAALVRLLSAFSLFSLFLLILVMVPFFVQSPKPETLATFPVVDFNLCITVFCGWVMGNALFLAFTKEYLVGAIGRFSLVATVQLVTYLLGMVLLARFWRWGSWRPWQGLNWHWVTFGYLGVLVFLPLTESVVSSISGTPVGVQLSLLPYFEGLSFVEGLGLAALAVFLGPIFEEIFFRGWLLGGLRPKLGAVGAVLVSSALFALVHGHFWGWPVPFVFGLITGWIAVRTGSIATSTVVHILWNGSTLLWVFLNI